MKIIFFLILTLSFMITQVYGESINHNMIDTLDDIEEKIRYNMDLQSQKSETIRSVADYWCLNEYLNQITKAKMYGGISGMETDENTLYGIGDKIHEKYFADDSFFGNNTYAYQQLVPSSISYSHNSLTLLTMDINIYNPLKMSVSEEILTNYNDTIIQRITILEDPPSRFFTEPCNDSWEKTLDINTPRNPINTYDSVWINLRGDLVALNPSSVLPLLERDYLVGYFQLSSYVEKPLITAP